MSLDPGFADGHYNLALSLEAVGRPADAERELRQAIILDPGLADAYGRLGLLLKREGRYEEAARYLGRMVGGDKRR